MRLKQFYTERGKKILDMVTVKSFITLITLYINTSKQFYLFYSSFVCLFVYISINKALKRDFYKSINYLFLKNLF